MGQRILGVEKHAPHLCQHIEPVVHLRMTNTATPVAGSTQSGICSLD